MTREETKKILAVMCASYPNYKPDNKIAVLEAWAMVFADVPYELVNNGLAIYLRTNTSGFAPSPGQIMGCIQDLQRTALPSANDAWGMVERAIRRSTYYSEDEYSKLPEIAKKCVGSPAALREMAISDTPVSVHRAQFVRAYECELNRRTMLDSIPAIIKGQLQERGRIALQEQTSEGMRYIEGGKDNGI